MLVLDSGFRALSERSLQEVLDSEMVRLIAAAEPQPGGGYAPAPQAKDSRLATPRSGLYAEIRSPQHQWRSPSTAGLTADFGALLTHGERKLNYASFGHDRVAIESRAIQFEDDPSGAHALTFSVAVGLSPYEEQLWRFRQQLVGWFTGLMLVLLVALAALLRWVLAPVRRMEREIHEVEEGRSETLGAARFGFGAAQFPIRLFQFFRKSFQPFDLAAIFHHEAVDQNGRDEKEEDPDRKDADARRVEFVLLQRLQQKRKVRK